MNNLQIRILDEAAIEADKHVCIRALYIFGSIVRGDHSVTTDVDIAVEYVDMSSLTNELTDSYTQWQGGAENWALSLGSRLGHKVSLHRMHIRDPEDVAWPAILAHRAASLGTRGKAMMVWTQKVK